MVHPALLRAPAASVALAGWPAPQGAGWGAPEPARRLFRLVNRWTAPRYRPELHYMRGGRTPGAKSLAAR